MNRIDASQFILEHSGDRPRISVSIGLAAPQSFLSRLRRMLISWVTLAVLVSPSLGQEIRKGVLVYARNSQPGATALPIQPGSAANPIFTGPPVKLHVANLTGRGVEIVAVKPDGTYQNSGMLPPTAAGELPAVISTFGGGMWQFRSEGRVLQFYVATNAPVQQVQIGQLINAPAPLTSRLPQDEAFARSAPRPLASLVMPIAPAPLSKELKEAPAMAREFLQTHNQERARLGIPPLRWSSKLARYAQQWAKHLASSGDFEHRSRSVAIYGENLFRGDPRYTPGDAAREWLQEKIMYEGTAMTRVDMKVLGHYTQMIWRDTTHVGFGMAVGSKGVVIVANYSPGGNREGQNPYDSFR